MLEEQEGQKDEETPAQPKNCIKTNSVKAEFVNRGTFGAIETESKVHSLLTPGSALLLLAAFSKLILQIFNKFLLLIKLANLFITLTSV